MPPVMADDVTSLLMVGLAAVMAALWELGMYNCERRGLLGVIY